MVWFKEKLFSSCSIHYGLSEINYFFYDIVVNLFSFSPKNLRLQYKSVPKPESSIGKPIVGLRKYTGTHIVWPTVWTVVGMSEIRSQLFALQPASCKFTFKLPFSKIIF